MDLIVVIMLVVGLGLIKIRQYGSFEGMQSIVESDVVANEEQHTIPVGNNLMLLKEKDAFEKILIQWGLKR